jgi:hypothetical protein
VHKSFFSSKGNKEVLQAIAHEYGFPGKLRNRELTGKLLQYAPDLFASLTQNSGISFYQEI